MPVVDCRLHDRHILIGIARCASSRSHKPPSEKLIERLYTAQEINNAVDRKQQDLDLSE